VAQPRDPWAPFRFWLALTLAVYALRAVFVVQGPGAIPGWVLLALVLVALALASQGPALPRPGAALPPGRWRLVERSARRLAAVVEAPPG
jgi:hypothetical protein